jgi:hypothetical protein
MTLTLDLSSELETLLQGEAARRGLPLQEYALRALAAGVQMEAAEPGASRLPTTGAEALAFWKREGVFGLFADRPDTPEFARELRRQAETRGNVDPAQRQAE